MGTDKVRFIIKISLLAGAWAVVGCQEFQPLAYEDTPLPYPTAAARPRSIVFESPVMHRLVAETARPYPSDEVSWYASRNDARPATFAGYLGTTYDEVVNVTYDHQRTFSGRTRDHYQTTTYRQSVTNVIR